MQTSGIFYFPWSEINSIETERRQNRVHGAAIIAQSTSVPQPNLATSTTHTNINRHSQESRLFLRPTYLQIDRLVSSYCSSAYYHLRTINNIRHLLKLDACHAAVRRLVLSRLDYCNALLLGGLNNAFRMMHNLPTYCSASEMFTVNRVADCKAVIRNLVHRFMMRLMISKHLLVCSILSGDLVCSSRIRRHWARLLYVHYHGG